MYTNYEDVFVIDFDFEYTIFVPLFISTILLIGINSKVEDSEINSFRGTVTMLSKSRYDTW